MGLTSAQRYNRRADQIWANKAEFDRLTENDKAPNYGVYCAHVEALAEEAKRHPEDVAIQSCPCLPSSLCYRYACPKYAAKQITTVDINSKTAAAMSTVVVELAHREALAEDNERDARDWSAFCSQVAVTKAAELEAAELEALEEADRTKTVYRRYIERRGQFNNDTIEASHTAAIAEDNFKRAQVLTQALIDANVREQSDMDE